MIKHLRLITKVTSVLVTLFPTVAPNITEPPANQMVVSPDAASFSCEARGVLRPNITWWKNESGSLTVVPLDTYITVSEDILDDRTLRSTLTINSTMPSDTAEYFCVATNDAGTDSASATLTVQG